MLSSSPSSSLASSSLYYHHHMLLKGDPIGCFLLSFVPPRSRPASHWHRRTSSWKVMMMTMMMMVMMMPLLGRNSIIKITLTFLILIITLLFMIVFIITIIIFSKQRTVWKAVWAAHRSLRADRWSSYASSAQEAQESLNEHHQILQIYSFLAKYITVFIFILK